MIRTEDKLLNCRYKSRKGIVCQNWMESDRKSNLEGIRNDEQGNSLFSIIRFLIFFQVLYLFHFQVFRFIEIPEVPGMLKIDIHLGYLEW